LFQNFPGTNIIEYPIMDLIRKSLHRVKQLKIINTMTAKYYTVILLVTLIIANTRNVVVPAIILSVA